MKRLLAAAVVAGVAVAAPAEAMAASLDVDPAKRCYRERERVTLPGRGFTPNSTVDVSRAGTSLGDLETDGVGAFQGILDLPGLAGGQEHLTYVATDTSKPSITARVTMLVTATSVRVAGPTRGAPNRRLMIRGRGFFGGETLWAHVLRERPNRPRTLARTVRIGQVKGACHRVTARRRLFRATARPGTFRVQFDTYRSYKPRRRIMYNRLIVRVKSQQPGAAASVSRASAR
jgi:hypothetical protein